MSALTRAIGGVALGAAAFTAAARRIPRPYRPSPGRRRLLAAAAVSAAAEELVWRGVALRLLDRCMPQGALGATSAAFALAHLGRTRARGLAIHVLLGVTLGSAARRRGGLLTACVAHATYDVLVLLEPVPP